eukprot:621496-Lingulodinium_polyedra.AAC.1
MRGVVSVNWQSVLLEAQLPNLQLHLNVWTYPIPRFGTAVQLRRSPRRVTACGNSPRGGIGQFTPGSFVQ